MKKLRVLIISILVFVVTTIVGVQLLLNGSRILKNFDIISVTNVYTKYKVEFESVPAAVKYRIDILDNDNIKVFTTETTEITNDIELSNLEYEKEYSLMVYAYDAYGEYRPANKEYTFSWDEPTFNKEQSILLDNKSYALQINGDIKKDNYRLEIEKDGKVIEEEKIKSNEYVINESFYKDTPTELIAKLKVNNTLIDSIKLYNKKNPVTNLNIISPNNDSIVALNDVSLIYEGGENAEQYIVQIYEGKNLLKETTTRKKHVIISKKVFEISKSYKIKVKASYKEFTKEAEVNFTMSDQEQLRPVYISNNWKNIKSGTKLILNCHDKDTTIYYTLNGENPESFGIEYKEPITIKKDVVLKTVAVSNNKHNSIISTYEIHVANKKELKVYISPSNQYKNLGVSEVGYTNERDEMNDLSNYIIERLESNGVKIYRNNSSGNINLWLRDSNYLGVDLHLAIHSNASNEHNNYGIETWIHAEDSQTYSLANKIQENLASIYPYKNLEDYNRGVKFANGALGEVNDNYLPFGILIEVAHHDYKEDAEWIMKNKKLIGYNIADSVLKYYQVIE